MPQSYSIDLMPHDCSCSMFLKSNLLIFWTSSMPLLLYPLLSHFPITQFNTTIINTNLSLHFWVVAWVMLSTVNDNGFVHDKSKCRSRSASMSGQNFRSFHFSITISTQMFASCWLSSWLFQEPFNLQGYYASSNPFDVVTGNQTINQTKVRYLWIYDFSINFVLSLKNVGSFCDPVLLLINHFVKEHNVLHILN
jgi:hypothetical protein